MDELMLRGAAAGAAGDCATASSLVTAPEAERVVESLEEFGVEEVGSRQWMEQHDWLNKLNMQAHHNAMTHSDEFVMEYLVSFDKVRVVVHELLAIELWKERVLPHLEAHLAERVDGVTAYAVQYHEAMLANLLSVVLFHRHAAESLDEDSLLELVDWCHRRLLYLNSGARKDAEYVALDAKAMMARSAVEEQHDKAKDIRLGVAVFAINILRYLTDHIEAIPMGVTNRMLTTNDTVMALVPLLDSPPWVRRRRNAQKKSVWERFDGTAWSLMEAADRVKMGQLEAQIWMALTTLLVEPKCRQKYQLDDFRKEAILKLRRFMNELLFDQLPILKDLQRVLDEISLNAVPSAPESQLILEAVPTIRSGMMARSDWAAVAKKQKKTHFGKDSRDLAMKRAMEMAKAFEFAMNMDGPDRAGADATSTDDGGAPGVPPVKVDTWRATGKGGVHEHWSDYSLAVDDSRPPEPVEIAAGDATVKALRHRLVPGAVEDTRALPAKGKVVVHHGQRKAEALLELPAPAVRTHDEGPSALWLTVGILASDGFALQLRLKKAARPTERDTRDGVWYAYHPVGGALTLARDAPAQRDAQAAAATPPAPSAKPAPALAPAPIPAAVPATASEPGLVAAAAPRTAPTTAGTGARAASTTGETEASTDIAAEASATVADSVSHDKQPAGGAVVIEDISGDVAEEPAGDEALQEEDQDLNELD